MFSSKTNVSGTCPVERKENDNERRASRKAQRNKTGSYLKISPFEIKTYILLGTTACAPQQCLTRDISVNSKYCFLVATCSIELTECASRASRNLARGRQQDLRSRILKLRTDLPAPLRSIAAADLICERRKFPLLSGYHLAIWKPRPAAYQCVRNAGRQDL